MGNETCQSSYKFSLLILDTEGNDVQIDFIPTVEGSFTFGFCAYEINGTEIREKLLKS